MSLWDRHRNLLITPMDGDYANVVCGEPADWPRFHTTSALNVLLLTEQGLSPVVPQPALIEAVTLYQVVYVPSDELAEVALRVTGFDPLTAHIETPSKAGEHIRATLSAHGILF
jgi:hypothetical protein